MKKSTITINIASAAAIGAAALAYTFACAGKPASEATQQSFSEASSALAAGDFDGAVGGFTEIIDSGERSAGSYYNLAIAQHRGGDLGRAILNYERAAVLEPDAADIRANLERARKDSATVEAPAAQPLRLANLLSPRGWSAVGASGFFALGLLAIGRATRLIGWPQSALRAASVAAVLAVATPLIALEIQHRAADGRAIISAADASLRVSPFDASKAVTSLTPGRSLRLVTESRHGEFHLARLESGQTGWVKQSEFSPITTK